MNGKKTYQSNTDQKKMGVALLILNRAHFRARRVSEIMKGIAY